MQQLSNILKKPNTKGIQKKKLLLTNISYISEMKKRLEAYCGMEPRERESTFGLGDGCRSRIPCTISTDQSTKKKKKNLWIRMMLATEGGFVELWDGVEGGDGGRVKRSLARIWD